jgi:hypothetical protein
MGMGDGRLGNGEWDEGGRGKWVMGSGMWDWDWG